MHNSTDLLSEIGWKPLQNENNQRTKIFHNILSMSIPEVESRTQGSRPRTQKKNEAKAKNSLSEDRHSRGQGEEYSRPRPRTKDTNANVLKKKVFIKNFQAISKKQKKSLQIKFSGDLQKNGLEKVFSADLQNFNHLKNSAVLEPRTGQFSRTWGFETKDFKMCLRGLYLWSTTCDCTKAIQ